MIRFTFGLALIVFTLIIGAYTYFDNESLLETRRAALRETQQRLDDANALQQRVRNIRKISMLMGDDQKFTLERLLDIGAPGMELRIVGQPRYAGGNRALFRHTFRISGPATFENGVAVLDKMANLPGFAPYKFCFACAATPKGTPEQYRMIQIEGYLYVYDSNLL